MRRQAESWQCERDTEIATMGEPASKQDRDELEAATNEMIALCAGDARAAVRALLVANGFLEDELAMAVPAVSYGYSKGWHARRRGSC